MIVAYQFYFLEKEDNLLNTEDYILGLIKEEAFSEFKLPIKIAEDNRYYTDLCQCLDKYETVVQSSDVIPALVKHKTAKNIAHIKNSLVFYYSGKFEKAKKEIEEIIDCYLETPLISKIDESPAFYGFLDIDSGIEPTFFRARVGRGEYSHSDLLPIPMTLRQKISTQRFSVPGIPCFYLGSTSYCCWLEMDKPRDEEFNVSAVKLCGDKKILDLAFDMTTLNMINIYGQVDNPKTITLRTDFKKIAENMIELWPLVCATSFVNKNHTTTFRSEYIISQIIMQIVSELPDVYGIAYLSKRIDNNLESGAFPLAVNLVIPNLQNVDSFEDYNHSKKYSDQLYGVEMSQPFNFMDYIKFSIHLREAAKMDDLIWRSTLANEHNSRLSVLDSELIPYYRTYFGRFDDYLNCRINQSISSENNLID